MKHVLPILAFTMICSVQGSTTAVVGIGDRVIVKGGINGCPRFSGVLAMHPAQAGEELDFFGIHVPVLGRTASEIESDLAKRLSDLRKTNARVHLKIDILKTQQEYLLVRDEVVKSFGEIPACIRSSNQSKPDLEELMKYLNWQKTA